jgi:hypothetical protein
MIRFPPSRHPVGMSRDDLIRRRKQMKMVRALRVTR